ncbi:MAG: D-sedoheptulose 7-phosphate isomerase [Flavobacteriales bacterium]|nr:D-sedoheptulose 7-phosphate isomerase [Flavobacteriales bacterium]MBL6873338.1 D-sedoheptulose 7-phosphate isomerase [Flavobacteriales bacterium]
MKNREVITNSISNSISVKNSILNDESMIYQIIDISSLIQKSFENGCKLLLCGNGGSAADAQHLAAEFSGRYYIDREPLHAEALHTDTSFMTAVANDYSFDNVYSRLVKGIGKKGDILIGLSTSGNSQNIVNALKQARESGLTTIGFTGENGGIINQYCDVLVKVPSSDTPRIQESHLMIGHAICELVEKNLFS